jgi:protein-histidine pros-kinase
MQRLVHAASALVPALARRAAPPVLPEDEGTREVRDAAHVFNGMATRLAQQFEARGLMIAAISHDLRTPLTRMRMRLETVQGDPELRDRCIADIREMNTLIDSVLDVFRNDVPEAARRQRLDLGALLQALVDDRAETGAAVSYSGQPMVVHAEPVALRRLVGNLVDNALRYAGAAEVTALVMGDACRILVQDRGPGIPQEQLDAVLQPFVRVEGSRHRATGGTGLGLFIARELAERLGGTLVLSNRAGGGFCAEVVLPLGEPKPAPAA